jgi:hypothetical protein
VLAPHPSQVSPLKCDDCRGSPGNKIRAMNIARQRLATQHIARPSFGDAASVVRWLGAVQAQDYLGALWGIGLRTRRGTERSVEASVTRGEIIRTWPMRGTLHFVAADDVRWMLALLTPRVVAGSAGRYRQLELDEAVFARSSRIAEKALEGGRRLQRSALYALWNKAGIATVGTRGLHIIGHLAQSGLLCFGPRDGKQPTLVLLEEWARTAGPRPRDESLGELARRYFSSHGPATVHDFAWWSGLTLTEARAATELARASLEHDELDGRTVWFSASAAALMRKSGAHLLPAWDEYTVAYRDRGDILDPSHARKVNAGGGVLKPVVVMNDRVVGTWQRTLGKEAVTVAPVPFRRLGAEGTRAVEVAAQRYGRFLGLRGQTKRLER